MTETLLECRDVYWRFAGQCTQCGHCTQACSSLTSAGMSLGEIAKAMLKAERGAADRDELAVNIAMDPQLTQAVRGCFFCTSCKNTCFAHNDVCDLVYHARVDFQNLGLIERGSYSSVLVDQEWDIFTAYRAIHGIGFTDLTRHVATAEHEAEGDCKVAFFPGCSLAAYGPELTREIFATLEELGGKTTMIDHCCGSPLKSAGFFDRAEALCERIAQEIADSGAESVVCVCPGCANAMRKTLGKRGMGGIEVVSLAAYLVSHGFEPKRSLPQAPLMLSKSCQDRDGSYLKETCALLGIDPATPTVFHGCCGAGGAVSSLNPNRQAQQCDEKLSFAPDGSTVITMCPTCTYTYAFRLMQEPRELENKHYTELVFENQFDWDLVFGQLNSMWSGEYGAWLAQVFA
ncbi:MAG: heterodisulfide reductase-related iron-sulfur binding cluster [Coriobacteriales bacterium]